MALLVVVFVLLAVLSDIGAAKKRKRLKEAYEFNPPNAHGASVFGGGDNKDLKKAGLFKRKGIRIGYSPDGRRALYYSGTGHLLTVAAARMGKGISLLIPALLSWAFSCIVVDPKAELASVTGFFRRKFGKVYVLNPFGILLDHLKGLKQARFNPMGGLDPKSVGFHAECDKLAAACVWDEGREGIHFTTAARMLVSGVIAALARHGKPEEKNLAMVAKVVSDGNVLDFCREAMKSPDPYIQQKLGRFLAPGAETSREVGDVISTAITQLGFISGAIAESLSGSDFDFSELKRQPGTTVYICIPLNMLDVCGDKYFRLVVETALSRLLAENRRGKHAPVLLMLDEFAQLGPHIKSIENAMGMAAGAAGLQLWCVLQDISQLMGMFPKTWQTFIQNCGVTMWFGARDPATRDVVSKLSGVTEVLSHSRSISLDPRTGEPHVNDSATQIARPLVHPHEVGNLTDSGERMLAFIERVRGPVLAQLKPYFRRGEFRGYRDNPYFKKPSGGFFGLLRG